MSVGSGGVEVEYGYWLGEFWYIVSNIGLCYVLNLLRSRCLLLFKNVQYLSLSIFAYDRFGITGLGVTWSDFYDHVHLA
jgi:hypothetical protein